MINDYLAITVSNYRAHINTILYHVLLLIFASEISSLKLIISKGGALQDATDLIFSYIASHIDGPTKKQNQDMLKLYET
ncbi:hypothetical protein HanIR_Chr10g0460411 [Helianthus annuus]|nr:hypothetical protein HanIR_Chr10g0460411 [Helianthus annuus]